MVCTDNSPSDPQYDTLKPLTHVIQSGALIIHAMNLETFLLLLLLLLFTATEFSLGGSSPYTSTDKTNENKYT